MSSITSFSGAVRAELDVGFLDAHVRLDALAVNRIALRREVLRVGEPQAAILGQLHEFLNAGAAERALADDIGALVAVERRDEQLRGAGGAGRDQERDRQIDRASSFGARRDRRRDPPCRARP